MLSLDEIFDSIVTIEKDPKYYISVYLIVPSDNKNIFEVVDIEGVNSIVIEGLTDSDKLEIGSWIRKSELKELEKKNKKIYFVINEGD